MAEEEDAKAAADAAAAADKEAAQKEAADKVVKDELAAAEQAKKDAALAAEPKKGGADEKSLLEQAKDVNEQLGKTLKDAQNFAMEQVLAGRTPAGGPSITEDEQKDADARKLIEGSGFEDKIFPKKK